MYCYKVKQYIVLGMRSYTLSRRFAFSLSLSTSSSFCLIGFDKMWLLVNLHIDLFIA